MAGKRLSSLLAVVLGACGGEPGPASIPAHPTVAELAEMLAAGETTSAALVEEFVRRSEAAAALNAMITVDAAGALARANELDAMRRRGEVLGPLHGVPIVAKDNIHVAGLPNTAGTPALADFVPDADNATVAALRGAGVIILGKANLHELAFGITSANATHGAVSNPFDPRTFAGGSSGGTAVAVAAGIAAAGLGTDTGGSVRIPAALTGTVGFRPTTGRYPSTAVTPISHTRDTIGTIAWTVADVIAIDNAVTGESGSPAPPETIRLGVPRQYFFQGLDAQLQEVIDAAVDKLESAGVELIEVDPDGIGPLVEQSGFPIALYEAEHDLAAYLQRFDTGVSFDELAAKVASPDVRPIFEMLTGEGRIPEEIYRAALESRQALRAAFRDYFQSNALHAMIFPTTVLPARPIGRDLETVELNGERVPTFPTYIRNTDPGSLAALPGISLPVGLTADGLPVGLELDGPEGSDRQLLAIAAVLERSFGFAARP